MIDPFERKIRRTLRQLSHQRVRLILQPGNVFVVDNAVRHEDDTDAALQTCWMRGWVELVDHAVPAGNLTPDGRLPDKPITGITAIYRMTDSGWSVVQRSHTWSLIAVLMAFLGVCAGLLGGVLANMLTTGH